MIVTIIDIATKREYQIEARSNGENAINCPVCSHERKKKNMKSLSFNGAKGTGHCHHCPAKFVEKGKGVERMVYEPKVYTKPPAWTNVTELSDKVVQWFNGRGINQQTLLDLKVTEGREWMPQTQKEENCIRFNYFREGELINVKYRDGRKNFKLVSGAELVFYNLDAIKGQTECVIVEGEMETLSFHQSGIKNVISVPNGASKGSRLEYMDNCFEYFDDMKTIYLATDNDEPGRALRDELARRIGKERCKIVDYGIYKDGNEVLQNDPLSLAGLIKSATDYPIEGLYGLQSLRQRVFDLKKNGLTPGDGISINAINELITWVPGYVTVITGVPNHGKGEFLDQIIIDLAHLHKWPFGVFSPENYPIELHVSKIASKAVGASFDRMSENELDEFMREFDDRIFYIMPPEDLTLDSILESAAILVKKYGIKGLVIDPWNKLDHQYTGPEAKYISACLDKMDLFARKYGVHVFVVAHPTKLKQKKDSNSVEVPRPYDISGTSDWYNKLANCLCVYRNFFEDGTSTTDIHVQKVKFKHWGHQGESTVKYDPDSGRYFTIGFQNKQSYLRPETIQTAIDIPPAQIKPNLNFSEPLKEQNEDDYSHLDPNDPLPF